MPTITRLEVQQKNKERVNLYLDDEFAFGLALNLALGLKVGQSLTSQDINQLQAQDTFEVAYARALNFLSYRARSEREIRSYLKKRTANHNSVPTDVVDSVLQKLRERGYVNDTQFAEDWVSYRQINRPSGRRMLAWEMRQKGLPQPTIEAALDDHDDAEAALEAARKQAPRLAKLDYFTFRQRLGQFLGRRGFDYETIADVVQSVWQNLHPDQPIPD